ncbi:hypothetical protein ACFV8T_37390 [Streptomyces sp. NPDC059832]|uniref:hypothetical protein n=1 Tax=unclassified Streptomyces TaxID=2593676 RepID=UPI00365268BA
MSTLMRAPKHCGSWYWDLEESTPTGPESELIAATLIKASQFIEVLSSHDLLTATKIEYNWYAPNCGWTGLLSSLSIPETPLHTPDLPERVLGSRPTAYPNAYIREFYVTGSGTWFDSKGNPRKEFGLVNLSLSPFSIGISAEVAVHHDIWSWFDFSGRPHPEVYNRNAPRLANALREITSVLGVEPDPGEPTYFGHAVGFGVSTPDADDDGLGPNLTDHL